MQPESSAAILHSTAPCESYVEADLVGPHEAQLVPGAQAQRRQALEEMHREMAQLSASGARLHTFFELKCQQLRQYYDEESHQIPLEILMKSYEILRNPSKSHEISEF